MNDAYPDGDDATRADHRRAHLIRTGAVVDAGQQSPRAAENPRDVSAIRTGRRRVCRQRPLAASDSTSAKRRRMVSDYVMTQHDCQGRHVSRGLGWPGRLHDGFAPRRSATCATAACGTKGTCKSAAFLPTRSPIGPCVPKKTECTNLLVPTCPSGVAHRLRLNSDGAGVHGPGSIRGNRRRDGDRIAVVRPGRRDQASATAATVRRANLEVEIRLSGATPGGTAKRLPFSSVLLESTLEVIRSKSSSGPCGNLCSVRGQSERSRVQGRSPRHC